MLFSAAESDARLLDTFFLDKASAVPLNMNWFTDGILLSSQMREAVTWANYKGRCPEQYIRYSTDKSNSHDDGRSCNGIESVLVYIGLGMVCFHSETGAVFNVVLACSKVAVF